MIFNGEIYNYKKIKKKLLLSTNLNLNGNSDSEILLNCIDYLGVNKTLELIDGMFAICLWDRKNKNLFLIRDRAGEKPLYYFINNHAIFFASELKSIKEVDQFDKQISTAALNFYFKIGFIPSTNCIYEKVHKLNPNEYIKINADYRS